MARHAPVSVRTLVAVGVQFPTAVRCALDELGKSMRGIAAERGLASKNFSKLINRKADTPLTEYREALCTELGVTREWLDEQLEGLPF